MSSVRIVKFFNCILWYSLYLLPIIVFIGVSIHNGTFTTFDSVFASLGLEVVNTNPIYTGLVSIFGSTSDVMPLFADTGILLYASYFASCYLIHFVIDVLLFLVKWAHSLISQHEDKGGNVKW